MDILSIAGFILGIGAILTGMTLEGGEIGSLVNFPAFIIVIGGTLGATLLQIPFKTFLRSLKMLPWVVRPPKIDLEAQREYIVFLANLARKNGLLSLEAQLETLTDEFVRKGIMLLVDGHQPTILRDVLELQEQKDLQAAKAFESMGGYAPTIGIIGAVLGLIHVMQNLASPASLGVGIATAFVATVYGVGSANLIFLPIAGKLKAQVLAISEAREMLIEGFSSIATGENPRLIEIKLSSYVKE